MACAKDAVSCASDCPQLYCSSTKRRAFRATVFRNRVACRSCSTESANSAALRPISRCLTVVYFQATAGERRHDKGSAPGHRSPSLRITSQPTAYFKHTGNPSSITDIAVHETAPSLPARFYYDPHYVQPNGKFSHRMFLIDLEHYRSVVSARQAKLACRDWKKST
jgi:hypothetical protein